MFPSATFSGLLTTSIPQQAGPNRPPLLRVLVVFNDGGYAHRSIARLAEAGYEVEHDSARARYEFEVRLRGGSYDVILADYSLRGWTGVDVLAAVKELESDTPTIVIGPSGNAEIALECIQAGAADYIAADHLQRLPTAVGRAVADSRARTQRAATEELVKKLTMAIDQSPASVIFTDASGTIQYVNQRFTEVTGYTAGEAIGQRPSILRSGSNTRALYADMWRTVRSGRVWRGELQNRKKDGALYWDSVSISPIRDSNGVVTHFLGCQEDITERKKSEQTIHESEERFRQLAENMQEVFFVTSSDLSKMLYVSPGYEQLWGRTIQSLHDNPQSFIDAVVEEDREQVFGHIATMQKGEVPQPLEFRIRRPDGSVRWVLVHAAPIKDASGVVYRITGTALDVTHQHAAEEALKESETRFRLLTEASFGGVVVSVNGVIREANQGVADIFGCTVAGAIGRPILDFVAAESQADVRGRIEDETSGVYEVVGKHETGKRLILEVAAKNHTLRGEPARITAVRDITGQRLLENQFRQAQKMEAVGRLAGGVAHDFNNLLTVIMTYTEMLTDEFPANDPRRDDLSEIEKASKAAAALTRQLLAFSRQQVVEPKLVHLEDVVTGANKMLCRLIGEDIELVSVFQPQALPVLIDPNQLEQVVMNLAVNARDAMPAGGKLTLETAVVELDEAYAESHWPAVAGRFAMLAVSDTGVGMSEETKARIFEPFFTTKEVGKGTGLGLATVYGIVKQSNGFIWVYSEPNGGTTFKLYFPLAAESALSDVKAEKTVTLRGNETVLLVEDSPAVRAAATRILQHCGYRVLEAPTGRAAIAMAASKDEIHLLLTDVVMPELSGRDVASQFTRLRPSARVLFMSGYTDDAVVRHGILQPGVAYLQKPFTGETLAAKVRAVLDEGTSGAGGGSGQ